MLDRIAIVAFLFLGFPLAALSATAPALVPYPAPAGVIPSSLYSVTVSQLGSNRTSFVYTVNNIGLAQFNWEQHAWNNSAELTTAWTSFDFQDPGATFTAPGIAPVTVRVSMAMPSPSYKSPAVRVLPSASKIVPGDVRQVGNRYEVSFQVNFATQYSVEFYDAASPPDFGTWVPENPLLIFANPLETYVPNPAGANVLVLHPGETIPASGAWGSHDGTTVNTLYFSPGVYDLGTLWSDVGEGIYVLHSNQTVYMAGGAYVKGAFVSCPTATRCTDAANITIRGRGILSGENFHRPNTGASFESLADDLPGLIQLQGTDIANKAFEGQRNAVIEGLTLIQAPFDNIYLGGINNWVNNVKLISWYPSTDGIKAGYDYTIAGVEYPGNGVVENSFLKDGDDSIHLYSSGLRVNNVVIWQSKNASPFQFGSGNSGNIDDVQVINSNVIHTEWVWPNAPNAVFDANLGGTGAKGFDRGYTFDEIHVENSAWQLFRLTISPTIWQFGNTQLGSLSNLKFRNIFVKDKQSLPDIFMGYDRAHPIRNVSFDNVIVAGHPQGRPHIAFDANRFMSLSGDIITEPIWVDTGAVDPNAQIWSMAQGTPTASPITTVTNLDESFLNDSSLDLLRRGDFFGDGYASPMIFDSASNSLGIWAEPLNPTSTPGALGYFTAATLPKGYEFAGVGDFNGDGISDVLLWNPTLQCGLILTLHGTSLVPLRQIHPSAGSSSWHVAGIGDFDQNGVSDVLLRDANGALEILYLSAEATLSVTDILPMQLTYSATPLFKTNNPSLPPSGEFDSSWHVVDVGTLNRYASIVWANGLGEIGITQFQYPSQKPYGNVIAVLPAGSTIRGAADYNGDGSVDLLLRDSTTGSVSFWYLNYFGGDYYQPAPATGIAIPPNWQN